MGGGGWGWVERGKGTMRTVRQDQQEEEEMSGGRGGGMVGRFREGGEQGVGKGKM